MAKRFKFRFSYPLFKLCRSKKPSCLPQKPTLAMYLFSPVNPKAIDISYPTVPEPPPCTPSHPKLNHHASTAKIVPLDGGWFSSEESESLFSSRSFDSSYAFGYPLENISETPIRGGGEKNNFMKRLISFKAGRVKESIAVVKRSENPHGDFKRSMLEMIIEKQMYDVKELEQLLQSFLSLNSAQYHGAIVEAFVEVWEGLFGKSPYRANVK